MTYTWPHLDNQLCLFVVRGHCFDSFISSVSIPWYCPGILLLYSPAEWSVFLGILLLNVQYSLVFFAEWSSLSLYIFLFSGHLIISGHSSCTSSE